MVEYLVFGTYLYSAQKSSLPAIWVEAVVGLVSKWGKVVLYINTSHRDVDKGGVVSVGPVHIDLITVGRRGVGLPRQHSHPVVIRYHCVFGNVSRRKQAIPRALWKRRIKNRDFGTIVCPNLNWFGRIINRSGWEREGSSLLGDL